VSGLKILHVLDHSVPLQSGYAFRTLAILREQRRIGFETVHVTSTKHYGASADEEEVDGLTFFRTRPAGSLLRRLPVINQAMVSLDTAARVEAVARRQNVDLIHAHSPALNGLAALKAGRRLGLPVVYEMRASWEDAAVDHGTSAEGSLRYRASRGLETRVFRRADAITTICEGLRKDIVGRGIAAGKVTVIPNAVDVAEFDAALGHDDALGRELGLGAGPVLGFIGSFYAYEGIDVLLRATPAILQACPQARVLLVGGGPAEETLRRLATDLGIADRVHFAGRVPHGLVRQYYALIDLLVYARHSIRLTETVTPLKPLEAMAMRRAFIASSVGGHLEVLPPELGDHLFKAGDPQDLAAVATRLLAQREGWPRAAEAGRRYVEAERTWARSVGRYERVYRDAIEQHRSR
jgi:PEP-CTERM/exosortase A-associated glycosyltransferase